jgi:hypothetical protein
MRSHVMKYWLVVLWLTVANSFGGDAFPGSVADNIHVHLVAARMTARPGLGAKEHLWVKFRADDERSRKILLAFPGLTNGEYMVVFTPQSRTAHEATLINVIRSCISRKDRDTNRDHHEPPDEWDSVKFELVLSIQRPKIGEIVDWDKWLILSLDERKGN